MQSGPECFSANRALPLPCRQAQQIRESSAALATDFFPESRIFCEILQTPKKYRFGDAIPNLPAWRFLELVPNVFRFRQAFSHCRSHEACTVTDGAEALYSP